MRLLSTRKNENVLTVPFERTHDWRYYARLVKQRRVTSLQALLDWTDSVAEAHRLDRFPYKLFLKDVGYSNSHVLLIVKVAQDTRMRDPDYQKYLPNEISKLIELAKIDDDEVFESVLKTGHADEWTFKEFRRARKHLKTRTPVHANLGEFKAGQLYNVEAVEAMTKLPGQSVHAIITDLPVGIIHNESDTPIPPEILWEAFKRILKPSGVVAVMISDARYMADFIIANRTWKLRNWTWVKITRKGKISSSNFLNASHDALKAHQYILIFSEDASIFNPQYTEGDPYIEVRRPTMSTNYDMCRKPSVTINDGKRHPIDLLPIPFRERERVQPHRHPMQKPVDLFVNLIKTFTNPGECVLDPFAGSGTTAIACIETGREFLAFEKINKYYRKAKARIDDAIRNNRKT